MTADMHDAYEEPVDIGEKLDTIGVALGRQADALERIAERFENFAASEFDDFYDTVFSRASSGIRNELKRIADEVRRMK